MLNPHSPEYRKILWGGLIAWLVQACIVLGWMAARAPELGRPAARHGEALFAVTPAAPILHPVKQ